jgi:uncharacterized glyoxalase superfamily protein PhnB
MGKRPARPAGKSWMIPSFVVKDPDAALDFYQRAFGFEKTFAMPGPDGRTMHAEMSYRDIAIMFSPEGAFGCPLRTPATLGTPSPMGLYVYCDDVDALYNRAVAAGAKAVMPPQDMFWGVRMCQVIDPDGHAWNFGTNVADFDPARVPNCDQVVKAAG